MRPSELCLATSVRAGIAGFGFCQVKVKLVLLGVLLPAAQDDDRGRLYAGNMAIPH